MFFNSLKSRLAMLFGAALVSMTVIGCGSSGDSSSGGGNPPAGGNPPVVEDKVVISEENRDQVVASFSSALFIALEAGRIYINIDPSTNTNVAKSSANLKTIAASETEECKVSGSKTVDFDAESTMTTVYVDCQEYESGPIKNGIRAFAYSESGQATTYTETFTDYHEKYASDDGVEISYKSATLIRTEVDSVPTSMSLEADGYFKQDGLQTDVEDYQIDVTFDGTNLTVSMSGRIKTTPCLDKWVEVETVTAVKMAVVGYDASCPTAGEVKVLGGDNTSLTLNLNADKSADVSINGGSKEHYNSCDDLPDAEEVCQ